MKKGIHPKWYPNCKVTCACGNEFTVGATVPELRVEVCSTCHPFFTGQMRYVDVKGRVQKFEERVKKATIIKAKKAKKERAKKEEGGKTYKEVAAEA